MSAANLGWNPSAPDLMPVPERAQWQRWAGHLLGLAILFSVLAHILLAWWMKDFRLQPTAEEPQRWVEIQLQTLVEPPAPAQVSVPEPAPIPEPERPAPAQTQAAQTQATQTQATPPPAVSPPTPTPPAAVAPQVITATPEPGSLETWNWRDQLLRQGGHLAPSEAQSGDATADSQLPDNWTRAPIETQGSWFDQYAPPGTVKQEVWEETDGSLRLQTTLANGQRLCGRVLPADPLQPFSVGVPTWTTCGKERNGNRLGSDNPLRRALPSRRPPPEPARQAPDADVSGESR